MTPKPIMAMGPEGRLPLERLAQPPVKPFHHPIGLRMIRPDQPMFDPVRSADTVQAMRPAGLPRGLPFFVHRNPIRKGPIIIGQEGVPLMGKGSQALFHGLGHRGRGAPGQHLDPDIAGGAVNGDQHITGPLLSFCQDFQVQMNGAAGGGGEPPHDRWRLGGGRQAGEAEPDQAAMDGASTQAGRTARAMTSVTSSRDKRNWVRNSARRASCSGEVLACRWCRTWEPSWTRPARCHL